MTDEQYCRLRADAFIGIALLFFVVAMLTEIGHWAPHLWVAPAVFGVFIYTLAVFLEFTANDLRRERERQLRGRS